MFVRLIAIKKLKSKSMVHNCVLNATYFQVHPETAPSEITDFVRHLNTKKAVM